MTTRRSVVRVYYGPPYEKSLETVVVLASVQGFLLFCFDLLCGCPFAVIGLAGDFTERPDFDVIHFL